MIFLASICPVPQFSKGPHRARKSSKGAQLSARVEKRTAGLSGEQDTKCSLLEMNKGFCEGEHVCYAQPVLLLCIVYYFTLVGSATSKNSIN